MRERKENGPFKTLADLYDRLAERGEALNKTAMEGLAYSNALSDFCTNKNQILALFPILEKRFKSTATDRALNQISLFGSTEKEEIPFPDAPQMSRKQELEEENEAIGVYLSGHPSQTLNPVIAADSTITALDDLVENGEKRYVSTCGMINEVKTFYTRKQELMASFTLESQFESIPCVVFPGDMASCLGEIRNQNVSIISGSYVQNRDGDGMQFIVTSITSADVFSDATKPVPVYIQSKAEQTAVLNFIKANPGNRKVLLCGSNGKQAEYRLGVNLTLRTLNFLSGEFRNAIW